MPRKLSSTSKHKRRSDQYNDPNHNYLKYWKGRHYEHEAEEIAINKLLHGRHFDHAVDIGGGYGRLCVLLENYADKVTLAEPSQKQLDLAKDFLKDHPEIEQKQMQADDLKYSDGSVDLVTMVRVIHHLPNPSNELNEISRILSHDGYAVIEIANYKHMRNRLKHLARMQRFPVKPVDIRSPDHRSKNEIPFVNHNPDTFIRQLNHAGLQVQTVLSVSNLRSVTLKRLLPENVMLGAEKVMQRPLAGIYFGPSIFFFVRKSR